jgi:very-short-patch-repair endonuclease
MIDYVVFFGIVALGFVLFIIQKPVISTVTSPRDNCESYIELRLYDALIFNGYEVSTQVPCGKYRIDLALTSYRLAIECDGKQWHSKPEQKAHDRRKNQYLRRNDWKVLRFSGRQINSQMPKVLAKINQETD